MAATALDENKDADKGGNIMLGGICFQLGAYRHPVLLFPYPYNVQSRLTLIPPLSRHRLLHHRERRIRLPLRERPPREVHGRGRYTPRAADD